VVGRFRCFKPHDLDKKLLMNYQEFEVPEKVGLGDGQTVDALGVGESLSP